jgi:hypothetical protein
MISNGGYLRGPSAISRTMNIIGAGIPILPVLSASLSAL